MTLQKQSVYVTHGKAYPTTQKFHFQVGLLEKQLRLY